MPAIEVFDTVVLKSNRNLVGIVDRTHYENNEPLEDILVVAHVQVDLEILTKFMNTGMPPKNYIFVRFSDEAQGSSLVRETDVILLDRSFNLGDVVKQENNHMLGTVINISESYVLHPTWFRDVRPDGTEAVTTIDQLTRFCPHICSSACPSGALSEIDHAYQNYLLHGIPGQELKKAEDILEADWVIQDDWVGIAEELELMVIVLMDDESIVIVKEPDELYIPVEDSAKPFVSLPEFDNFARPDFLVALQGWSTTIPPHDFHSGQLVITNHRNLRQGRWLHGKYDENIKPQGRVLDVRTKSVDVRWLACNALIPNFQDPFLVRYDTPPTQISLYENTNVFVMRSELRSNKRVTIYDHSRFPRKIESRARQPVVRQDDMPTVHTPTDFRVGDRVKFRDQAGAALKYQGVVSESGLCHGKFDRILPADTFGFDVNELKIVCSQQECTILWQDGSHSTSTSKNLIKFNLFEPELAPADIVVAREGMKQTPESPHPGITPGPLNDFNEMTFFEKPHDLVPQRVGIVQSVNQAERVASVRWFLQPNVCLTGYGHVLNSNSRLGPLSGTTEDVSLYEIMTFPALIHRLKDLVIIPSGFICQTSFDIFEETKQFPPRAFGQTTLSHIGSSKEPDIVSWLHNTAAQVLDRSASPKILDDSTYQLHSAPDWVGEIVELGLDGLVTVRLNTRSICRDVRLEYDQVICTVDDGFVSGAESPNFGDDMDLDMSEGMSDDMETATTISETVEYEGGERLDNDSGDDNWEDEIDDDDGNLSVDVKLSSISSTSKANSNQPLASAEPNPDQELGTGKVNSDFSTEYKVLHPMIDGSTADAGSANMITLSKLRSYMPEDAPPCFSILERQPPADQHQNSKDAFVSSPNFLKRIAKEHRILASSLPNGEIFVRTYETRLDLIRCLIIGPADTPYEHAPFLIDLQLPKNFPKEPPIAYFHSWTSGLGRINPNLYEEGKICLSLLGTWPGKAADESWSEKATILQLLVSLQGLVFVRNPFYNEAGFEEAAQDGTYRIESQRYNEKAYVMARGFVKHAVMGPVAGLEDVLAWTFLPHNKDPGLLHTVTTRGRSLIESSEQTPNFEGLVDGRGAKDNAAQVFLRLLSRGAIVMLKKTIDVLEELYKSDTAT